MILDFYRNLPLLINPVAFEIGTLSIRWYSLMYIVGFLVVWMLLLWRIGKSETLSKGFSRQKINDNIFDLLLSAFFSGIIGGRIAYIVFYDDPGQYLVNPLRIISPFNPNTGHFEGIYGMSYHGAILGGLIGMWIVSKFKKIDLLGYLDFIAPALPLGYFFGRIGNFLNGELYGRVTNNLLGMFFQTNVQELRYPSQLFEAITEGLILFVGLWLIRNRKMKKGNVALLYIIGYGIARFVTEFFRQPDPQIGLLIFGLTMGQILSILMIVISSCIVLSKFLKKCYTQNCNT